MLAEIAANTARFGSRAETISNTVRSQLTELFSRNIDVSPDGARRLALLADLDGGTSVSRLIELIKQPGSAFAPLARQMDEVPQIYVGGQASQSILASNFDHFIETISKVARPGPNATALDRANYINFMKRMGAGDNGNPNMLRAMYGEAKAISCIGGNSADCVSAGLPAALAAKLGRIDPTSLKLDDRVRYTHDNQEGVDAAWRRGTNPNRQPDVFLESKIRGGKDVNIPAMRDQFRKHLETKVRSLSTVAGKVRSWNNGEPPIFVYDMRGGAFVGKEAEVRKQFEAVLKEFKPALPDFDIKGGNIALLFDSDNAVFPWVNIQEP